MGVGALRVVRGRAGAFGFAAARGFAGALDARGFAADFDFAAALGFAAALAAVVAGFFSPGFSPRLSLRVPGRERGRLPRIPGSSSVICRQVGAISRGKQLSVRIQS